MFNKRRRTNLSDEELRAFERQLAAGDEAVRERVETHRVRLGRPAFDHDCDACVFLGHDNGYDLYVCPGHSYVSESVLARYSSDGPDYTSQMAAYFAIRGMGPRLPDESPLVEAWRRAKERNLFQFARSRGDDVTTCRYCGNLFNLVDANEAGEHRCPERDRHLLDQIRRRAP